MLLHDSSAHGLTFLSPRTPHPMLAFALLMLKKYYLSVYLSCSVRVSSTFFKFCQDASFTQLWMQKVAMAGRESIQE
jgi:hypothetical protein